MSFKSSLEHLQNLPVSNRIRIMWSTAGIIAVVLVVVWAYTTTQRVKTTDTSDLKLSNQPSTETPAAINASETKYVNVEWVEWTKGENVKIFFKVSNPTDNILNFSKVTDVTTIIRDEEVAAKELTDRQGKPFVQKILGKTDNFGIAVFENVSHKDLELEFNQMYFENELGVIFSEIIKLDLEKLNKTVEIRS